MDQITFKKKHLKLMLDEMGKAGIITGKQAEIIDGYISIEVSKLPSSIKILCDKTDWEMTYHTI